MMRRRYMGKKESALPGGGKRIEFLESSGTQWIDTGIKLTPYMRIEIAFYIKDITMSQGIFGANYNNNEYSFSFLGYTGVYLSFNFRNRAYGAVKVVQAHVGDEVKIVVEGNSASLQLRGTTYTPSVTATPEFSLGDKTCYVFAVNNPRGGNIDANPCSMKMTEFKISDGDMLLAHYVPAEYKGHACAYDWVTGNYIRSAGTDDFILQQDYKHYEEILQPNDEINKIVWKTGNFILGNDIV